MNPKKSISQISTIDESARETALDPARSFIVEAPAGSGKTGLLTQRYLRLLSVVKRPEAVVAMTFMRKAAAEMKERVEQALASAETSEAPEKPYERRTWELARAVLSRDREYGWNLLRDTSRLQIQTIDSFCAMLTRQMPLVSEFGGIKEVVEDASELYRAAARRTIFALANGDVETQALFRSVSLHFDNDIALLERQIANMLSHREQWRFLERAETSGRSADFRRLLSIATRELNQVFRERQLVDFAEVTRAAIRALGTPEQPADLLYWLDYRIEHLLVDEFQDTSRVQYELLEALTREWSEGDGRSLFLVGDPMQSIFRFREAEVSLFLRCCEQQRLGNVKLLPLRLTTNFRSTPEIVAWTQETFTPIMNEDDVHHGGVKLRPAEASRPKSGFVPKLIALIDDDGAEEAQEIVRILEHTPREHSIAILVRSRAHVASILPALRRAGIGYDAVEIERLGEQQHILDLLSLTRAILHLGDRAAWLACLRAPWCGLTLADLSLLAEAEPNRTIFDLLSDPAKVYTLSPEGRTRAVRLQEILAAAVKKAGRMPLRELVEGTWIALGGPALLQSPGQRDDIEALLSLIEAEERGGIIPDFDQFHARLEWLCAKACTDQARVQVMTIHQAKGLEFDTVILPKLGSSTRTSERELLIWTEKTDENGETYLELAALPRRGEEDPWYRYVADEIKQKDANELKRLFYVAVTRAKDRLYLLGNTKKKKDNTACQKPREGTFLSLIWSKVEADFESERRRRTPVQRDLFEEARKVRTVLRRLPADWRLPQFEPSVIWQPELTTAVASAGKVTYEWVSNTGRHVGTVAHRIFKRIAREGLASWPAERVLQIKPLIESELLRLGVSRAECEAAANHVLQAISNTLRSERGRWILSSNPMAESELAVGGRVGGLLVSGTIDRVFRDEQGRLWIVDFKTSEHEGGNLERFLDEEQRRYRPQLERYAALMAEMHAEPIWLGLYFPLLDAWREWTFEEVAIPAH